MEIAESEGGSKGTRQAYLDYLRAFAIIMVVVHHVLVSYRNSIGVLPLFGDLLILLCYYTHVPLFFVIAGYLSRPQPIRRYYAKRLRQLLIPFLVFSAAKLLYKLLVERGAGGKGVTLLRFVFIGEQYWFVYAMLLTSFFAPVLWKLGRSRFRFLIPAAAIMLLVFEYRLFRRVNTELINVFQLKQTVIHLPYFMLGMSLRLWRDPIARLKRFRGALLCVCAATVLLFCVQYVRGGFKAVTVPNCVLAFGLMYLLLWLARLLPNGVRWLSAVGKYSLQIMLFDAFVRVAAFSVLARLTGSRAPWYVCAGIAAFDVAFGALAGSLAGKHRAAAALIGVQRGA